MIETNTLNNEYYLNIIIPQKPDCIVPIRDKTEEWISIAQALKSRKLDKDTKERLSNCKLVCLQLNEISTMVSSSKDFSRNPIEFVTAEDAFGNVQAIMSIYRDSSEIHVMDVVTNPRNLIPENARQEGDPNPFRGAPKALMVKIIQIAKLSGHSVTLTSIPLSCPFYERLGFVSLPNPTENSIGIPMVLEAQKISEIYSSFKNG